MNGTSAPLRAPLRGSGSLPWWRSPIRWTARRLGDGVEALARVMPTGIAGFGDRWVGDEAVGAWMERRFATAADPLLAGRPLSFAREEWPAEQWPTLYMDIPADIRRPVIWDGRIIGGRPAEWLAWRQLTHAVVAGAIRAGIKTGLAWALVVASLLLVVAGCRAAGSAPGLHPYPAWASAAGASSPLLWWYVERAAAFVAGIAQGLLPAIVAALAAATAASYFVAAKILRDWWDEASRPLRQATRDSRQVYDAKADVRSTEYLAYLHQVKEAAGRLHGQPSIAIGTATGALRARGDMAGPVAGQLMAMDGESIREHFLALGAAGSGKTRLLMLPLFKRIMKAHWGFGHRLGAIVMDGKGTLWRDLMPLAESCRDPDAIALNVIGTGPDHRGVDLLAHLAPFEIAATLRASAGLVGTGQTAWATGSLGEQISHLVSHVATLCDALDGDAETLERCAGMGFRPRSLVGIHHFAASSESQAIAIDRLHELRRAPQESLAPAVRDALSSRELWVSVKWLETDWRQMAHDCRTAIVGSLETILGPLLAAGELRDRFAAGLLADPFDLSRILDGGILMVAVGETEWDGAGTFVSRWIKTSLFALARKKLEANRERFRDGSLAFFADDFQVLATPGPNGDSAFWNIAREAGIFLVAATRSLKVLGQVLGEDEARSFLDSVRTTVALHTQEPEILEHLTSAAGDLPKAADPDGIVEPQAGRDMAVPAFGPDRPADRAGLLARLKSAAGILRPQPVAGGPDQGSPAVSWRPKLAVEDFLLGGGRGLAIVRRAGASRVDIVDLADGTP